MTKPENSDGSGRVAEARAELLERHLRAVLAQVGDNEWQPSERQQVFRDARSVLAQIEHKETA